MRDGEEGGFQAALMGWYDGHAREMPWRVPPGRAGAPDPYRVWLSEVMLQQTTVATVRGYFERFIRRWPDVAALAAAADGEVMAEWAGLGYYARARNLLACARAVVARHGGVFPPDPVALRALPGVGPYTAAAVAAIAFDLPEVVVDGNVERVMARLYREEVPLPDAKPALVARAAGLTPLARPGDHAQAVMDLGATICTPRSPSCTACPVARFCDAKAAGVQADLPARRARPAKPVRRGVVWLAFREDGAVLVERRAARGLLGGMLGFPGDGWDGAGGGMPLRADWREAGRLRHTFTHFHLDLVVMAAAVDRHALPARGEFHSENEFAADDLPTLMKKAYAIGAATPRLWQGVAGSRC